MRRLAALLLTAVVVAFAACGDDDDDNEAAKQGITAGSGQVAATLKVSETEFALDPANPKIAKSGLVRFDVRNDGEVEHSLEVEGSGGEAQLAENLQPGETGSLEVNLEPGRYEWYCPVGDHKQRGMRGVVTVAGGDGKGTTTSGSDDEPGDDSGGSGSDSGSSGGSGY
jgi:plastocyanin